MIGVTMGNDIPSVAAPNSRVAVLGSDPIAYAISAGERDPILLDMATAAVAGGKAYAAWRRGEPIPPTWIVGPDGKPTTDGSLYPAHASLAPMAGHKGFGLGLLVETLAGLLTCGAVTWRVGSRLFDDPALPMRHNAAFLAIDVAAIAPRDEFSARVAALIDEIHKAPKAEGAERIFVPGEMEWERRRKAIAEGIDLPPDVRDKLQSIVKDLQLIDSWIDRFDVDHFSIRNQL
jgi:ureidoglycolate dehydrogenase (NAD+)